MNLKSKSLLLLILNALIPGFGPLFFGIANLSFYGIIIGILLITTFSFLVLVALNGDFLYYKTYQIIFKEVFNFKNNFKLERSYWTVVLIILILTLLTYTYIVYFSFKASKMLCKSLEIQQESQYFNKNNSNFKKKKG